MKNKIPAPKKTTDSLTTNSVKIGKTVHYSGKDREGPGVYTYTEEGWKKKWNRKLVDLTNNRFETEKEVKYGVTDKNFYIADDQTLLKTDHSGQIEYIKNDLKFPITGINSEKQSLIVTTTNRLLELNENGRKKWILEIPKETRFLNLLRTNNELIALTKLQILGIKERKIVWQDKVPSGAYISASNSITAENKLFVGLSNGEVYKYEKGMNKELIAEKNDEIKQILLESNSYKIKT